MKNLAAALTLLTAWLAVSRARPAGRRLLGPATCATAAPSALQACINAYVLKNPSFQANFGCSGAGAGAAAQNCVNAMVDFAAGSRCGMQQQQCVHSPGVNCTRQYQACINAFAVAIQEQGGGGAVGAAGVAPPQQPTKAQLGAPCANITALAAQQACINRSVTATPYFAAWNCTSATPPQACINNKVDYVNNAACAAARLKCLGDGGSATASCQSGYQACINKAAVGLQGMFLQWAANGN